LEHIMVDRKTALVLLAVTLVVGSACSRRRPAAPVTQPAPPPAVMPAPPAATGSGAVQPVPDPQPVTPALADDRIDNRSLDDLNRNSPLKPVYFQLDSADLDDPGRAIVSANAELLKRSATWVVTVEGHCDERGTAEYNLALGERRAAAVRTYLVSLGIAPERVRTVSYGKEFPFDPGHSDGAWAQNRRAHFVITAR
jgi:peptidoglycan-associated lipoprotein